MEFHYFSIIALFVTIFNILLFAVIIYAIVRFIKWCININKKVNEIHEHLLGNKIKSPMEMIDNERT